MNHQSSSEDQAFRKQFETGLMAPADFNHQAHIRLAYIYLCENEPELAYRRMRRSLQAFLAHHGVGASKYHETMTRAWTLAVRRFMAQSPDTTSAARFIEHHPKLLEAKIMLTHYSEDTLFSDAARSTFIEPDLEPIPNESY